MLKQWTSSIWLFFVGNCQTIKWIKLENTKAETYIFEIVNNSVVVPRFEDCQQFESVGQDKTGHNWNYIYICKCNACMFTTGIGNHLKSITKMVMRYHKLHILTTSQ